MADIERAARSDLDRIVDLWVELLAEGRSNGLSLRAGANRAVGRQYLAAAIADGRVLVARADGIVGFASLRLDPDGFDADYRRGLVENVYVVPGRRSEGVGSELLAAAEDRLRELGAEAVSVEALVENDAAVRFYRERGYAPHRLELEKHLRAESDRRGEDGSSS